VASEGGANLEGTQKRGVFQTSRKGRGEIEKLEDSGELKLCRSLRMNCARN